MHQYGSITLAERPSRFLTDDSVLTYQLGSEQDAEDLGVREVIRVAAIKRDGSTRWFFLIVKIRGGEYELRIGDTKGWEAFRDMPDLFETLGLEGGGGDVVQLLWRIGAVERVR